MQLLSLSFIDDSVSEDDCTLFETSEKVIVWAKDDDEELPDVARVVVDPPASPVFSPLVDGNADDADPVDDDDDDEECNDNGSDDDFS